MKLLKGLHFITIIIIVCVSVLLNLARASIQPTTLSISANQEGVFKCTFNNTNQPLPKLIIWRFNNSVVENFPITRQKFLEQDTNEDGVTTITSTLTFEIELLSASVFNDTTVECLAVVINEDLTQDLKALSAKLYIYGLSPPPSGVRVNFAWRKLRAQWTHADIHNEIEHTAYHIYITPMSDGPIQSPPTVMIPGNYSQCFLYEVCVMEETLAGIGHPACINISSNISVLGAIDIHVTNASLLNHTNTSSAVEEEVIVGCSGKEMEVHMQGNFHDANLTIRNSTTSLELKLPAPYVFTPNHAITLELNLLQPNVEDLVDVKFVKIGSVIQLQCVYAENSLTNGCLIIIDYDGITSRISLSSGESFVNIAVQCTFSCASGSLYGYANNHGVVANEPSIMKIIDFEMYITSLTSTPVIVPASVTSASAFSATVRSRPVPTSACPPTAQGSLTITAFVLILLMYCLL